jgi:hypothetical protein
MRPRIFSTTGLLIALAMSMGNAADLYVSPTGNDAAAGTSDAPLATLAAARDKADQLKTGTTAVTVYLRGGTYYLSAPVVFGAANSGAAQASITYAAYAGEKPVLSGGIKLSDSLAWTVSSGNIMVTTIALNLKVDQLFLNGKRQIMARYPNFDSTKAILDGYDANCFSTTRVATWKNPAEGPGYIRALHPNQWGSESYTITAKNSDNTLAMTWAGDNNNGNTMHPTYRMVENIFEELDAPGEWFYRKSTGQLYFYPPAGTNLKTAKIELASQDELIRIIGTSSTAAAHNIIFDGLTFTQTYRTLFSKPYMYILRSDWHIAHTGAVFMQNTENIKVQNCFFDQVGGNAIFMDGYNRYNLVYNNNFVDGGASCVNLIGDTSSVRCPFNWSGFGTCTDRTPGPRGDKYPAFITVSNNMMNHLGRFEKQTSGVNLGITECATVIHNTVHDCPRAAININNGCFGGHQISYNWLYNTVLETEDHGPFNAWGRDRNLDFKDDTSATQLDAWKTTLIHNNRLEVRQGLFGLDLDDQSSNYLLYNNLLFTCGLKIQWSRHNTYYNNILVNGANTTITNPWWGSNDYITRNIFTSGNPYWCNFFTGITNSTFLADTFKSHIKLLDSNLFANGVSSVSTEAGSLSLSAWRAAGLDVHSISGDPMFVNVNQTWPGYSPKGNYQVQSGSPALTLGFKNFPMDSFGVMKPPSATRKPFYSNGKIGQEDAGFKVCYSAGRLTISHTGDYRATITTALGRTVKTIHGKGNASISLNAKTCGAGIYFVVIRAKDGLQRYRFLVE